MTKCPVLAHAAQCRRRLATLPRLTRPPRRIDGVRPPLCEGRRVRVPVPDGCGGAGGEDGGGAGGGGAGRGSDDSASTSLLTIPAHMLWKRVSALIPARHGAQLLQLSC